MNTIKENKETPTDSCKNEGIGVNTEKAGHMLMSGGQNTGQNHNVKLAIKSFECVEKFRYLGVTVTNQNCIN
jgi:hypothetical protein